MIGLHPREVFSRIWLKRQTTAELVNRICNDPSVFAAICAGQTEPLDYTTQINNMSNVALGCDKGVVMFWQRLPGIYEMHTACLPEGRGELMSEGAAQAFFWMFTETNAVEILTHCPDSNLQARLGAKSVGMHKEWTVDDFYPVGGKRVNSDVYGIAVKDWVLKGWYCREIGAWFHDRLRAGYEQNDLPILPHSFDQNHDTIVGAAVAMIYGGQVAKGIALYNRWALFSNYPPVVLLSKEPVVIDLGEVCLQISGQDFQVLRCRSA